MKTSTMVNVQMTRECQEVSDFLHHAYFLQKEKKKTEKKVS